MSEQKFSELVAGRSTLFMAGVGVIAVLLIVAIWWVMKPSYVALHKEATESSQADILAILSQRQVPYRINAKEGLIEVPAEHIGQARIHLSEAGIPTRTGVGYELFDNADYGMSEFSQKINYQRALEGELARSVMTISEVKFARVHLTLKRAGFYQAEVDKPKASVIVRLRPNAMLNTKQVQGIQHLVASAVEGMTLEHVVILDEEGRALSAGDGVAAMPERFQLAKGLEDELQDKVTQLLQRSFGAQGAQVSVRVLMNFDRVKSVSELPVVSGQSPVLREKQLTSSTSGEEAAQARNQQTREVEYVVGKQRSETEHAVGVIERVSVGIVLSVPQSDEVMKEMQRVLEAALGLSAHRGDTLVITYMPPDFAADQAKAESMTLPAVTGVLPNPAATIAVDARQQWLIVLVSVLLFVLVFYWWTWTRNRSADQKQLVVRLNTEERDQLVTDLRRWLQEGK
ncbi:MAG: flagellar basal-body MS-ring/collar protein FliF [Moraxellaceae bacterium]|nr:flagellar basal-body MS-ring/collar protein FliF [Moraxellaceae bacterium]MDZ4385684.1 flagellar basal-body MS-ring/collar protein FliF [Moraxellaceae bacterium]